MGIGRGYIYKVGFISYLVNLFSLGRGKKDNDITGL